MYRYVSSCSAISTKLNVYIAKKGAKKYKYTWQNISKKYNISKIAHGYK